MNQARKNQYAWACYDWANSAFATTVLVVMFPILFNNYYAKGLDPKTATFYLGVFGNSLPSLIVVFLAPWLGVMADKNGWKKRMLAVFTVLGAGATAALSLVGEGHPEVAIFLFGLAGLGFFGGLGFYDALLVNVAQPQEQHRVSALGYSLGYLGGGVLLLVNLQMVLSPSTFGFSDAAAATKAAFVSVSVWWLLFSIPLFISVREKVEPSGAMGWAELKNTVAKIISNKPVMLFLLAYWLYIDAVGTVAIMATDFGQKLGFADQTLIKAILIVQFVSFPAALAFGWLAGVIGAKRGIYLGLSVYIGVTLWALNMQTEQDFYLMAATVGLVQGGVQSLSRSYFANIIPAASAGQYFGFYNMLGKFAAVLGPLVVGVTAQLTGNPRISLFMLIFFFIGGMLLLSRVKPHTP